jgi:hypothetical protein
MDFIRRHRWIADGCVTTLLALAVACVAACDLSPPTVGEVLDENAERLDAAEQRFKKVPSALPPRGTTPKVCPRLDDLDPALHYDWNDSDLSNTDMLMDLRLKNPNSDATVNASRFDLGTDQSVWLELKGEIDEWSRDPQRYKVEAGSFTDRMNKYLEFSYLVAVRVLAYEPPILETLRWPNREMGGFRWAGGIYRRSAVGPSDVFVRSVD